MRGSGARTRLCRSFSPTVLPTPRKTRRDSLVLSSALRKVPDNVPCKTLLVLSTLQRPGALCDVLAVFRDRRINITRIQSRPVPNEPWQELFFLDFDGNGGSDTGTQIMQDLARVTRSVRILGCYPSDRLPVAEVPASVLAQSLAVEPEPPAVAAPARKAAKSWKLVSREHKSEDTTIEVQGVKIGERLPGHGRALLRWSPKSRSSAAPRGLPIVARGSYAAVASNPARRLMRFRVMV